MENWIFNALLLTGFAGFVWISNYAAKSNRSLLPWMLIMASIALIDVLVMSFRVMGLSAAFEMMAVASIWFLLWVCLLVVWIRWKRHSEAKKLALIPLAYMFLAFGSNVITDPQIDSAQEQGNMIASRILNFQRTEGHLPESLDALQDFDRMGIPETGVGFWGHQGYRYHPYEDGDFSLYFDAFVGVQYFRSDDGSWFAED